MSYPQSHRIQTVLKTTKPLLQKSIAIALFFFGLLIPNFTTAQTNTIVLGRPTDTSITVSIQFSKDVDFFIEYGTTPGIYTKTTPTISHKSVKPDEVDLHNLYPNTQYYYRVNFKLPSATNFTKEPEHHFHTQRPAGSEFTFTIEADEHLYDKKGVANMYKVTLENQAKDNPDFMLSLGDIFGDDHNPFTITSSELDALHKDYRPFLGAITHSIPFYVCLGNHEGEMDYYLLKNPGNNLALNATLWRKYYYPNPYPNGFYSGNGDKEPYGVENPENYYSWKWGDALFVVMDVYRDQCDSSAKPGAWSWTLGLPQYTWLKNTLEGSTAKYKFVFAHHVSGQGRGAAVQAKLYEWGGYDGKGGTNYNFPNKRPGWAKPIHKLFVDNGVNVFFQGHDHLFAHEILDGIHYQEVPMPSDSTYMIGKLANADAYTSDTLDGTGHIRVKVKPSCVTIDYVKAYLPKDTLDGKHHNGEVGFSYTIGNCGSANTSGLNEEKFSVYPNPAKDKLIVRLPHAVSELQVYIYNTFGQLQLQSHLNEIDISQLNNGVYYVTAKGENYSSTQKIIVQK